MQVRPVLFIASLLAGSVLAAATGASVLYVGHFSGQDPSQELPTGWTQIQYGDILFRTSPSGDSGSAAGGPGSWRLVRPLPGFIRGQN